MSWKSHLFSRRDMLKISAGAGAGLALGNWSVFAQSSQPAGLIQRAIPSSGERLPLVGIGTARRYNVGTSAEERAPLKEVLKRLPELGGKLVDTAPSYGTAETVVGDLVRDIGNRDRLFIATKVRKQDLADAKKEIEQSFEILHTDKIDLIQVHNLVGLDDVLPVLREMKAAGRIRYVGVSTSSGRQYADFIKMMEIEDLDFIQVNYSMTSRTAAERILPLARDRGMAVLVNLPYSRGRVFQRAGDRAIPDWAADYADTWGQFFLKYILANPAVTCVIPGTAKIKYLEDNLGAARGPMPDAAMQKRMEQFYDALPS
ncbi:MAG TPA: aldo/keto reductase [candidate division Zixibacteria bacterium]|nr:aldo/keto reductase [candidate division Zixibacteria bacterium]